MSLDRLRAAPAYDGARFWPRLETTLAGEGTAKTNACEKNRKEAGELLGSAVQD